MFFFLLIILLVIFGLALLNIIGHIILWVFFAGLIIGGYGLLSQLDYKHLIAISFFLIALKLFIDSIRKSKKIIHDFQTTNAKSCLCFAYGIS